MDYVGIPGSSYAEDLGVDRDLTAALRHNDAEGYGGYGTTSGDFDRHAIFHKYRDLARQGLGPAKRANPIAILASVVVPWFIFVCTFWIMSFEIRNSSDSLAQILAFLLLGFCAILGYIAFNVVRTSGDPFPCFLFVASLIAWGLGFVLGGVNYTKCMRPYYDIQTMMTYPSVTPSDYKGQQLMDAGQIIFTPGSHINTTLNMVFRNDDVYCVAPIVSEDASAMQNRYDFWAVGLNCCTGQLTGYMCGEYSNPEAHSGLRLMDDSKRAFYRLAVQQAEATYNILAPHPIFMTWLESPEMEINAHQEKGMGHFIVGMSTFFAVELFVVLFLVLAWARLG